MDFPLPELGEGVYEAEAVRWLVEAGQTVKPGQTLLEVLTDKATMEVPSPFAGVVEKLLVEPGDKLAIGQVILKYRDKTAAAKPAAHSVDSEPKVSATTPRTPDQVPVSSRRPDSDHTAAAVKAAPSVRLMARKLGVDLANIQGSGPAGRIVIDDLTKHLPAAKAPVRPSVGLDYGKPGTRVKFAGLRRKIAEHLVQAKHTIPHYTYVDECDASDLVRLREALKEPFAAKGAKLTYLAFFVKAVVAALKEVPIVNAALDEEAGEIVLYDRYDIGIAVAAPGGLIVPVVKRADQKSLLDITRDIERLTADARMGKSELADLKGGTFTITSIGNVGGLFATPIIHHPQLGILGVGKIVQRPVVGADGQVKPADMVYLSCTFDHRVLDGVIAAVFCNALIQKLATPAVLLLE